MKSPASVLAALSSVLVAGAACGGRVGEARPQWIVHVHTDAPVPQLGDRLLVEILGADGASACSGCRRLLGVPGPAAWPLSFGIPDEGARDLRLRVRLFRADHSDAGGAPVGGLPIDVVGALPPTGGSVRHVHVVMWTACAGVAADVGRMLSCDPQRDDLAPAVLDEDGSRAPAAGSSPLARAAPCTRPAPGEMVCVEGGLFVRGNSMLVFDAESEARPTPERLVRVSPFFLDRNETTVREIRALVAKGLLPPVRNTSTENPACTFTSEPGAFEDFPVNCISRELAEKSCVARGKRLPTEAEWEYAAGNRGDETTYPWGGDADVCRFAVVGRGRVEAAETAVCRTRPDAEPLPWGPRPVSEGDDVTALGVRHLAGNLSEWVADAFAPYDESCPAGRRVLEDPRCDAGLPDRYLVRGGSWPFQPLSARIFNRGVYRSPAANIETGVRCAQSM